MTWTHLLTASLADAGRGRRVHLALAHGWIFFECCVVDEMEVGMYDGLFDVGRLECDDVLVDPGHLGR